MSFKQKSAVFAAMLVVWTVVLVMALPWVTPAVVADTLSVLIDYPPLAVLLGGIVIVGLLADRLQPDA